MKKKHKSKHREEAGAIDNNENYGLGKNAIKYRGEFCISCAVMILDDSPRHRDYRINDQALIMDVHQFISLWRYNNLKAKDKQVIFDLLETVAGRSSRRRGGGSKTVSNIENFMIWAYQRSNGEQQNLLTTSWPLLYQVAKRWVFGRNSRRIIKT